MSVEPTKTELPDLGRQIFYLSQLVELTSGILEDCNGHVAGQPVENLDRVHEDLVRLSKEISRLQEERGNLLALADVGNIVNSSLDLNDVLCIVMDNIVRLTGAERGFLMLKDEAGEMATTVARNWEQESIDPTELSVSRTVINRVVTERVPVLTTNAQEDPRFGHQASVVFHNLRSILCVPLILRDEITGVIYADHRVRTGIFTETHRNLLVAFANQAAVAIENARLFESVRRTLAEVTELKNLLDNVFASLVSGVITADEQNKISLCNRAAQSILGQSESDLIGKTLGEILPDIGTNLNQFIDTVRRTDRPITGKEVFPVLPRRGKVTLNLHISPLKVAADTSQGVAIVLDDLTEKKRLEGQYRLFERMISPAVICQLDPDKLQLGGKRTAITTMFADIRDFTGFSESLAPETLVSVLNRYLAAAADAVLAQDGTIDKFLGDALMA